ncbi:MAG: hypothetical protein DI635_04420 [Pseudoxanthomonas suwonensis]|nr:MAG: hypothetical protein DI635_04420 [Pseudoxanthomonas suwonensis]
MQPSRREPARPDDTSGYPETQPHDAREARHDGRHPKRNPDEGGLQRDPEDHPQPHGDDPG